MLLHKNVVPSEGLEPSTYSLGNCRSILMSYGGKFHLLLQSGGDTVAY